MFLTKSTSAWSKMREYHIWSLITPWPVQFCKFLWTLGIWHLKMLANDVFSVALGSFKLKRSIPPHLPWWYFYVNLANIPGKPKNASHSKKKWSIRSALRQTGCRLRESFKSLCLAKFRFLPLLCFAVGSRFTWLKNLSHVYAWLFHFFEKVLQSQIEFWSDPNPSWWFPLCFVATVPPDPPSATNFALRVNNKKTCVP